MPTFIPDRVVLALESIIKNGVDRSSPVNYSIEAYAPINCVLNAESIINALKTTSIITKTLGYESAIDLL